MAGSDYGSQLWLALEAAQTSVQQEFQSSAVQRGQTAVTLGHAQQTLSVNDDQLVEALAALKDANKIFKLASQGKVVVQSTLDLATSASAEATAAVTAMSTAAANIKTLSAAFDTLVARMAGVSAVAHADDRNTAMDQSAEQAALATTIADKTAEQLKAASLNANVESARSVATTVVTEVQALGTRMQDLSTRASGLVSTATQKVNAAQKADSAAQVAATSAMEAYHVAMGDDESLDSAMDDFNSIANGALQVVPYTELHVAPCLMATYHVPDLHLGLNPEGKKTKAATNLTYATSIGKCLFFAVPFSDVTTFDFDAAYKLVLESDAESTTSSSSPPDQDGPPFYSGSPVPPSTSVYSCQLSKDVTGQSLQMGQTYCVFVLRLPLGGIMAAIPSDLSLPSAQVTLTYALLPPAHGSPPEDMPHVVVQGTSTSPPVHGPPFTVTLTLPHEMQKLSSEYRAIVMREDVYSAIADDVLTLANLLDAAFYKDLQKDHVPDARATDSYSCTFTDGDTDAFGDMWAKHVYYRCLVLIVGGRETPHGSPPSSTAATPENTPNVLLGQGHPSSARIVYMSSGV